MIPTTTTEDSAMDTKDIKNQLHNNSRKSSFFFLSSPAIFLVVCIIIAILYLVLKDSAFEGYPVLTDLIIDNIALGGSNKTGEWNLFWNLTWIGCFLCLGLSVLSHFLQKKKEVSAKATKCTEKYDEKNDEKCNGKCNEKYVIYGLLLFLPAFLQTILYAKEATYLWLFSALFYILLLLFKETAYKYIALYLFLYFDLQAFATILSLTGLTTILSSNAFAFLQNDLFLFFIPATILCFIIFMKKHFRIRTSVSYPLLLVLQLPLPLLLCIFLKNTYQYQGALQKFSLPNAYIICIVALMIALYIIFAIGFSQNKEKWEDFPISLSSILSIFLYGSFIPATMMVPTDLHHYGEQMLPFSQIVNHSMQAYGDYAPVSGFFPMIPGFINAVLFDNQAATFYASFALTMILFAILMIVLIRKHIPAFYTLMFAFLFHMPVYCRTWMILPVLLFLMLPEIRTNKRRFLYSYVFYGFLSGLYYPLFGLALICACMPYALAVFYSFCKEKMLVNEIRKKSFYIETVLLLIPIVVSIPLLIRMARHVLSYSHQTLLADGLSLSGISVPDWFIPYFSGHEVTEYLRTCFYYAVRFLTPMALIWICILLLSIYIRKNYVQNGYSFQAFLSPAFYGLSACLILLPVCYTYTLVIMDESWVCRLFSRSGHIFLWIFGAFLPILFIRYGKEIFQSHQTSYAMLALSVGIGMASFHTMQDYQFPTPDGVTNSASSVIGEYSANFSPLPIPDNAVIISEENRQAFPRLGNGFIAKDTLSKLYQYQNQLAILKFADPSVQVLGLDSGQLYYFLLDEKVPYSGKVSLAKSFEAACGVVPFINEHTAIGSDIRPLNNYYLYRLIMDRGYVFDPLTEFYLPKEIYSSLYGENAYNEFLQEEGSHDVTPFSKSVYLVKVPSVLAANLDHLSNTLTDCDTRDDFLYVTLNREKLMQEFDIPLSQDTVFCIGFEQGQDCTSDYRCMYVDYEQGKWILPLGINEYYLAHANCEIYLSVYDPSHPLGKTVLLKDVCDDYQYYTLTKSRRLL